VVVGDILKEEYGQNRAFPEGLYPRMPSQSAVTSIAAFRLKFGTPEILETQNGITLNGMAWHGQLKK
jgi:hypothetical protein